MIGKELKEKGITLIALVITVVILIILATVTLNVVLGEGGLIQRAQQAKELTEQAALEEQQGLNSLMSEMTNIMEEEIEQKSDIIVNLNGYNLGEWTYKEVIVNLSNSNNLHGKYQYSINDEAYQECEDSITISNNRKQSIQI